eukprot:gene17413-24070_t
MKETKEKELKIRPQLQNFTTVQQAIASIRQAKNIIVITGAGISVSCGIPDFRTKEYGLYDSLDCEKYNIPSAELLFDLEFFKIDPKPFYTYMFDYLLPKSCVLNDNSESLPTTTTSNYELTPSMTHLFILMLEAKQKLLRNYTQNIDGLESRIGISNLVECHGSYKDFICINSKCKKVYHDYLENKKLSKNKLLYCVSCGDVLKPNIIFFGETGPVQVIKMLKKDVIKCDLLLILGTSLKVGGAVHEILKNMNPKVPQILINKVPVNPPQVFSEGFDVSFIGSSDDIIHYITKQLNWKIPTYSQLIKTKVMLEKESKMAKIVEPTAIIPIVPIIDALVVDEESNPNSVIIIDTQDTDVNLTIIPSNMKTTKKDRPQQQKEMIANSSSLLSSLTLFLTRNIIKPTNNMSSSKKLRPDSLFRCDKIVKRMFGIERKIKNKTNRKSGILSLMTPEIINITTKINSSISDSDDFIPAIDDSLSENKSIISISSSSIGTKRTKPEMEMKNVKRKRHNYSLTEHI